MLFDKKTLETDHLLFRNLRKSEFRPDISAWCEVTFERARMLLDDDFSIRFRRETPQRISELFFAAAFLDVGWEPLGRVLGFDLAFRMGAGRLLVEVTTPNPHSPDTWTEDKRGDVISWSTDARTEDAALRRLTSGFATKAEKIRERCKYNEILNSDYVVIAISAFRLNQEAHFTPEIEGPVPGFAKAFLPIGSQYLTVSLNDDSDAPLDSGWHHKSTIDQEGKSPVDRNFFLRPEFDHIDAVAYTPLNLWEPLSPAKDCAALHNPMARSRDEAVALGFAHEYGVEVGEDEFSIGPLK
jgi:hypothetical protein